MLLDNLCWAIQLQILITVLIAVWVFNLFMQPGGLGAGGYMFFFFALPILVLSLLIIAIQMILCTYGYDMLAWSVPVFAIVFATVLQRFIRRGIFKILF